MSGSLVAPPRRHIASVNAKLAGACIAGAMAYLLWPTSAYWWTFYPLSIMCGAAAFALILQAMLLIRQIRKFERDQQLFEQRGRPVKAAALVREDDLIKQGIIRDAR